MPQVKYEVLYNRKIILPEFLHMVAGKCKDIVRLSRIDMTVDYFNHDINISELCNRLRDETIIVQDDTGKKRIRNIDFMGNNEKINTIYIGSRKTNTKAFLRIYDKRYEQISTNGYRKKKRFFDIEASDYMEFTKQLIRMADGSDMPALYCPSPRDNALNQSIMHIKYGSGLYSTLYKIGKLYGSKSTKI